MTGPIEKTFYHKIPTLGIGFLFTAVGVAQPISALAVTEQSDGGITNPLGQNVGIDDFLINVIQFLLGLSALLAFAALIYGGIRLVTSFGSDQNVKTGKSIILWAIVGMIVIILSYAILFTVANFLNVNAN